MKPLSRTLVMAALALVVLSTACGAASPAATATAVPAPTTTSVPATETPDAAATTQAAAATRVAGNLTRTAPHAPTWTPATCFRWDEVSAAMKGQKVCTRGIVTKLTQTRQVGSRYQFTDKSNGLFLYSKFWEIYDTKTGKTIGPGTCVEVTGTIQVQSGIPYINIDEIAGAAGEQIEGFQSYDDPTHCK